MMEGRLRVTAPGRGRAAVLTVGSRVKVIEDLTKWWIATVGSPAESNDGVGIGV